MRATTSSNKGGGERERARNNLQTCWVNEKHNFQTPTSAAKFLSHVESRGYAILYEKSIYRGCLRFFRVILIRKGLRFVLHMGLVSADRIHTAVHPKRSRCCASLPQTATNKHNLHRLHLTCCFSVLSCSKLSSHMRVLT